MPVPIPHRVPGEPTPHLRTGLGSRHGTVNRARLDLGGAYAFARDVSLDLHALHQRDTRSSVARVWAPGATPRVTR